MIKKIALLLILSILIITGCDSADEPVETQTIRLPMGFIPDPQYAPYYVAVEKGYFAAAGFEIEFDYSFETDGMALVGAGELPFAIVSGEQVVLARAEELPVVYVLEWFQKYPIAVVSKTDSNISDPADLAGRTVGLPGFWGASYVGYVGLLSANGIQQDAVVANDIGFTQFEAVLSDQVEAAIVYANNEPVRLQDAGESVNVIPVSDYIDLVANGIITNEDTMENDPEMVQRFVNAILQGLDYTLENPDEAYEISKNFVEGLDDSRKAVLDASIEMWETDQLGYTEPSSWDTTQSLLMEMGLLDSAVADLDAAYTNNFVNEFDP